MFRRFILTVALLVAAVALPAVDAVLINVAQVRVAEVVGSPRGSQTAAVQVSLSTPPAGVVTILIDNPAAVDLSAPSSLDFTPTDWNVPQTIVIAGIDDVDQEGDETDTLTFADDSALYNGTLDVTVLDQIPEVSVRTLSNGTEGGSDVVFELRRTAPTTDRITVSIGLFGSAIETLDWTTGLTIGGTGEWLVDLPAEVASVTFALAVIDDVDAEDTESIDCMINNVDTTYVADQEQDRARSFILSDEFLPGNLTVSAERWATNGNLANAGSRASIFFSYLSPYARTISSATLTIPPLAPVSARIITFPGVGLNPANSLVSIGTQDLPPFAGATQVAPAALEAGLPAGTWQLDVQFSDGSAASLTTAMTWDWPAFGAPTSLTHLQNNVPVVAGELTVDWVGPVSSARLEAVNGFATQRQAGIQSLSTTSVTFSAVASFQDYLLSLTGYTSDFRLSSTSEILISTGTLPAALDDWGSSAIGSMQDTSGAAWRFQVPGGTLSGAASLTVAREVIPFAGDGGSITTVRVERSDPVHGRSIRWYSMYSGNIYLVQEAEQRVGGGLSYIAPAIHRLLIPSEPLEGESWFFGLTDRLYLRSFSGLAPQAQQPGTVVLESTDGSGFGQTVYFSLTGLVEESLQLGGTVGGWWQVPPPPGTPQTLAGVTFDAALLSAASGTLPLTQVFGAYDQAGNPTGNVTRAVTTETISGITCRKTAWSNDDGTITQVTWDAVGVDGWWYLIRAQDLNLDRIAGPTRDYSARPLRTEPIGAAPIGATYVTADGVAMVLADQQVGLLSPSGLSTDRRVRIYRAADLTSPYQDIYFERSGSDLLIREVVFRDAQGVILNGFAQPGGTGGSIPSLTTLDRTWIEDLVPQWNSSNSRSGNQVDLRAQGGGLSWRGDGTSPDQAVFSPFGVFEAVWQSTLISTISVEGVLVPYTRVTSGIHDGVANSFSGAYREGSDGGFWSMSHVAPDGFNEVVEPSISVQPAPLSLTVADTAVFRVGIEQATSPAPKFQWWSRPKGGSWAPILGAVTPFLVLSDITLADDGTDVYVVVDNGIGSIASGTARLTVGDAAPALPIVSVTVNDPTIAEADGGSPDSGQFTITSDQPAPINGLGLTLNFSGSAVLGIDYTLSPSTLIIPEGQTTLSVSVIPTEDGATEGVESLAIAVGTNANYTIGAPSSGNLSIAASDVGAASPLFLQAIRYAINGDDVGPWGERYEFQAFAPAPEGKSISSATFTLPDARVVTGRVQSGGSAAGFSLRELAGIREVAFPGELMPLIPVGTYLGTLRFSDGSTGVASGTFTAGPWPAYVSLGRSGPPHLAELVTPDGTGTLTAAWTGSATFASLYPINGTDPNRAGQQPNTLGNTFVPFFNLVSNQAYEMYLTASLGDLYSVHDTAFSTGSLPVFATGSSDLGGSLIGTVPVGGPLQFIKSGPASAVTTGALAMIAENTDIGATGLSTECIRIERVVDGHHERFWLARASDGSVYTIRSQVAPAAFAPVDTGLPWPELLVPGGITDGATWNGVGTGQGTLFNSNTTAPRSGITGCIELVYLDGQKLWFKPGLGLVETREPDGTTWHLANQGLPVITQQPRDVFLQVGQLASISVSTANTLDVPTYTWYRDGFFYGSGPSITVAAVGSFDDGATFTCQIDAANGSVVSRPARIRIETASAGPGLLALRLINPLSSIYPGQGFGVLAFRGPLPLTLSAPGAIVQPGTGLANGDVDGDGTPDVHRVFQVIPLAAGSLTITGSDGLGNQASFVVTVQPPIPLAPGDEIVPAVEVSPARETRYAALSLSQPGLIDRLIAQVLATDDTQLRAFGFDSLSQRFVELPETPAGGFAPSDAVFVASRVPLDLGVINEASVAPFALQLRPGWNFVGVPPLRLTDGSIAKAHPLAAFQLRDAFGDAVPSGQVASLIGTGFFLWNGTSYVFTTEMNAGSGYFIKNNTSDGTTFQLVRDPNYGAILDIPEPRSVAVRASTRTYPARDLGDPPAPPASTSASDADGGGCGSGLAVALLGSLVLVARRRRSA